MLHRIGVVHAFKIIFTHYQYQYDCKIFPWVLPWVLPWLMKTMQYKLSRDISWQNGHNLIRQIVTKQFLSYEDILFPDSWNNESMYLCSWPYLVLAVMPSNGGKNNKFHVDKFSSIPPRWNNEAKLSTPRLDFSLCSTIWGFNQLKSCDLCTYTGLYHVT